MPYARPLSVVAILLLLAGCGRLADPSRPEQYLDTGEIPRGETVVFGRVRLIENGAEIVDLAGLTSGLELHLYEFGGEAPRTSYRLGADGTFAWSLDNGLYLIPNVKRWQAVGAYSVPVRAAFRAGRGGRVIYIGTILLDVGEVAGAWARNPTVSIIDGGAEDVARFGAINPVLAPLAATRLAQRSERLPARAEELDSDRGYDHALAVLEAMGLR